MSGPVDPPSGEQVFLGLGGNLGDPRQAMVRGLIALNLMRQVSVVRVSSLYRTPPWGKLDQPDFLNAVAELRCVLKPRMLLNQCLGIERAFNRQRGERWGPRSIDLDIIAFGIRTVSEPGLELPHPRLCERAFVLKPLAEIAPQVEIAGQPVFEMLAAVDCSGIGIEFKGGGWFFEHLPDARK